MTITSDFDALEMQSAVIGLRKAYRDGAGVTLSPREVKSLMVAMDDLVLMYVERIVVDQTA